MANAKDTFGTCLAARGAGDVLKEDEPEKETASISLLYMRHIDMVYRICLSILGNATDAEDVAQGVFTKLIERRPAFQDEGHEKAWLIVTAKNSCKDFRWRWWRRKVTSIEGLDNRAQTGWTAPEKALAESFMKLPADYRILSCLHYHEGYKLAEIAGILHMNLNTVKSRMRKAKELLKLELGEDSDD
jgi:RNA polymerase sigma-70 factor (ECF subfamily)